MFTNLSEEFSLVTQWINEVRDVNLQTDRPLIVADPMLATEASLLEAMKDLLDHGRPSQIHIVATIASEEGVELFRKTYPKAHLWVGVLDPKLTDKDYIYPGLGDAGDLSFGQKLQS